MCADPTTAMVMQGVGAALKASILPKPEPVINYVAMPVDKPADPVACTTPAAPARPAKAAARGKPKAVAVKTCDAPGAR